MRELCERYGSDRRLTIAEYETLGQLDGAVRQAADGVIEAGAPTQEDLDALQDAFVPAMVRVNTEGGFVRRRAVWADLPARAHRLLQGFVDARLLVSRVEDGERVVEVAHEALFLAWPRLDAWLRADRDQLRLLDDLEYAAQDWQDNEQDESWLVHQGERLEAAEALARAPRFAGRLNDVAKAYLDACLARRRAEQERAQREAEAKRQRLEAEARAARVQAEAERERAEAEARERAQAEAYARRSKARRVAQTIQTQDSLLRALQHMPRRLSFLWGHRAEVLSVAFSPDGKTLASGSSDKTVVLWDIDVTAWKKWPAAS